MSTDKLLYELSALHQEHFKLCGELYLLEVCRQKIGQRGYQAFDKEDILGELGKVQGRLHALHGKLVNIADTLKTL